MAPPVGALDGGDDRPERHEEEWLAARAASQDEPGCLRTERARESAADDGADGDVAPPPPRGSAAPRADCMLASVAAFHRQFGIPVVARPALPGTRAGAALRVGLLAEELQELRDALAARDVVEVADALADLQYVLLGTAHEFGMGACFAELFDEVHRSNMTKASPTRPTRPRTVAHYARKDGTAAYALPTADGTGRFHVYRAADEKTLKSVSYSPAARGAILDRARARGRRLRRRDAGGAESAVGGASSRRASTRPGRRGCLLAGAVAGARRAWVCLFLPTKTHAMKPGSRAFCPRDRRRVTPPRSRPRRARDARGVDDDAPRDGRPPSRARAARRARARVAADMYGTQKTVHDAHVSTHAPPSARRARRRARRPAAARPRGSTRGCTARRCARSRPSRAVRVRERARVEQARARGGRHRAARVAPEDGARVEPVERSGGSRRRTAR